MLIRSPRRRIYRDGAKLALLKKPDESKVDIVDGYEYSIERSKKVKSIRVRSNSHYMNQYEVVVEFKDTSILFIDETSTRKILGFIKRHRFLGIPIDLGVKIYLYEPGNYVIAKNHYGRLVLGDYNEI